MILVTKKFKPFDAAHQLPNHDGKCRNLHGHTYHVEADFEGRLNATPGSPSEGMVIDFSILSEIYDRTIYSICDHALLMGKDHPVWFQVVQEHAGEILDTVGLGKIAYIPVETTTAENLAVWMFNVIESNLRRLTPLVRLVAVRVYETESSCALVTSLTTGGLHE